jgi:hypothetical protein
MCGRGRQLFQVPNNDAGNCQSQIERAAEGEVSCMLAELEYNGRPPWADEVCNLEVIHGGFHSRIIWRAFSATVSASNSILLYHIGFNARRSL